jgi:hypothetical protein
MKSKQSIMWGCLGLGMYMLSTVPVYADSVAVNFESPGYTVGNINGQDGWSKTGPYDAAVVSNTYGYSTFGSQVLRISNAITTGSFGDQTFAKPLTDAVGEADATNGTFSPGLLQRYYVMQFDIASADPAAQQPGLAISVSPDRGDGSRMSYLSFVDGASGIDVTFYDVQGTDNPANFVPTVVATGLDRSVPHTIKLTMQVNDGPSNDIVNVYIDGNLVHTGTTWENYYRYDSEASAEQSPRIVKSVIFRSAGTAAPATLGAGFLFDNVSLTSSYPPLTNGSFEDGPGGSYAYIPGGSSSLTDWLTTLNGVEWFDPGFYGWGSAKDGAHAVDLAPTTYTGGGVQKSIDTVPGKYYKLQFYASTLTASGRDGTGQVDVLINGNLQQSFSLTNTKATVTWYRKTVYFGATGPTTTVEFQNNQDPYTHFAFMDDVSVAGPLPLPDLDVSHVSFGNNITRKAGTNVMVADTVDNLGGSRTGKFKVGYHLSTDMTYGNADDIASASTRPVTFLDPGASSAWPGTSVVIPEETPPGTYYLCAKADVDDVQLEADEGNNTACTTATITVPKPDLYISSFSKYTSSVTAGDTMKVSDWVTNKGGSQALAFDVGYTLSPNGICGDGDDIALPTIRSVAVLNVGASDATSTDILVDVPAGSYYVCAVADAGGVVDESNEANNAKRASGKVTVSAAAP